MFACTAIAAQQSSTEDVAEAARQERARKEAEHKKPRHVYTEEDLKRVQILTPEDRAELEAKRNEQLPRDTNNVEGALDALPLAPNLNASALTPNYFPGPLPADAPLGDVARYYRRWKASQALRREQQFPLSLPNVPVLASPKAIQPLDAPLPLAEPVQPRFDASQPLAHPSRPSRAAVSPEAPQFTPFQPPVKRSPFAHPKFFAADPPRVLSSRPAPPSLASQTPAAPAKPSQGFALASPSKRVAPAKASKPLVPVNPPALATPGTPTKPSFPALPSVQVAPMQPSKPFTFSNPRPRVAPAEPRKPSTTVNPPSFGASPAPSKGLDSTGPSAPVAAVAPSKPVAFGNPSKPVVSSKSIEPRARVNPPAFVAPLHPPKPLSSAITPTPVEALAPPSVSPDTALPARRGALTVQPGDSLWKLAVEYLGRGPRWREFLAVNPKITNANHIEAGSQIFVPAVGFPSRKLRTLTVQHGDTLSGIAKTYLRRGSAWPCVARANPAIHSPHVIYPGQSIFLPDNCNR